MVFSGEDKAKRLSNDETDDRVTCEKLEKEHLVYISY